MPTYTRNAEADQYAIVKADYDSRVAAEAKQRAEWQTAHDEWVANGEVGPEPLPPTHVDEPPPAEPTPYESREPTEPEQVETSYGTALVIPPQLVLSSADGHTYAVSPADLARDYTEV